MGVFTGTCISMRLVGNLGCGLGLAPSFRFCHCGDCRNLFSFKLTGRSVATIARRRAHAHGVLIRGLLAFSHAFKSRGISTLIKCACRSSQCHCVRNSKRKVPAKVARVSTTSRKLTMDNGSDHDILASVLKHTFCSCGGHCLLATAVHHSNSSGFNSGCQCNGFPSMSIN